MSATTFEDVLKVILEKFITLKNEVSICLQENLSHGTAECIDRSLDFCYYGIVYEINRFKTQGEILASNNEENTEQLNKLRIAEHVIQLQTSSAIIAQKINNLVTKNENSNL